MKANEAPEKIYLTTFGFPISEPIPQESSNPDTVWSKKPYIDADSIEYTRTDAFIEKACEFLKTNVDEHIYFDECNQEWYDTEELIKDFKNYMKGE